MISAAAYVGLAWLMVWGYGRLGVRRAHMPPWTLPAMITLLAVGFVLP